MVSAMVRTPCCTKRCLAQLAVIAVAAELLAGAGVGARAADPPPPGAAGVAELEQAYTGLEKTVRELPRDRFDPQAVIEAAGREADGLFAWVRDNTAPLPYRGALRGS